MIGAGSFFVTAFTLLGTSDCPSVDFGGGRVIGVTCYPNSYGTMPKGGAVFLLFLIGVVLILISFWEQLTHYFKLNSNTKSMPSERVINMESNKSTDSFIPKSIKHCNKCKTEIKVNSSPCPKCFGKSFTYTKTSEEYMADAFPEPRPVTPVELEFKDCPMCAEPIRFKAIKCRYCRHLLN